MPSTLVSGCAALCQCGPDGLLLQNSLRLHGFLADWMWRHTGARRGKHFFGVMCGVTVSTSAFCFLNLPPMLLCEFEPRLGLESSDFSMWHFLKLVARRFLQVLRFPPLLRRLMIQPVKLSSNKCDSNSVKLCLNS